MGNADSSSSDRNAQSILHLVKQVQYKAYVQLESVFHPLGVTAVQFRILSTLSARPGTSSAELARLYGVKPQTMIKQIALLEAKGLIAKQTSKANKRLLELRLTPGGKACLKQCKTDSAAMERELLSPLGQAEQDQLRAFLTRLHDSLSAHGVQDGDHGDGEEFTREYSRAGVQRG
ncbi:MAG: MarR family transcriptional regulator [Blastomonas sp.]